MRKAILGNALAQMALLFGADGPARVLALVALGLSLPVVLYLYNHESEENDICMDGNTRRTGVRKPSHKKRRR